MIENILKLLSLGDYKGVSDNIDFAKGKYKIPRSLKEVIKQLKRQV